jgi:hypothetical protein
MCRVTCPFCVRITGAASCQVKACATVRNSPDGPRHELASASRNGPHYAVGRLSGILVLPNSDDGPACGTKALVSVGITRPSRLDLVPPPLCIIPWPTGVLGAAVPEAAVNKDADALPRKADVGASARAWNWVIDPVSQPGCVKDFPDLALRPRVAPSRSLHPPSRRFV